ncbi:MAG: C4-dicarboxylate ABC transporter [Methylobacter sp.]
MIRIFISLVFILSIPVANALDAVSLDVAAINSKNWKLEGVNIALTDLTQSPQKLALTIDQLSLPNPFNDLKLVNIRCTSFTWRNEELLCKQGRAEIYSKRWQSPSFNFSFFVSENYTSLKLTGLQLAGGTFAVNGDERGNQWRLQVNARAVDGKLIWKLLQIKSFEPKAGKISFKLDASGSQAFLKAFSLNALIDGLTVQTKDGRFATESLTLKTNLDAQNHKNGWHWHNQSSLIDGALYIEPLYLEAGKQSISWDAQGRWDESSKQIEIQSANYNHSRVADLSGSGFVSYKDGIKVENADLSLRSEDLQLLSSVYLKPFFEQSALEGVSLAGNLQADFSIVQHSLTALSAAVNNLEIKDAAGRAGVRGGVGTINWSVDESVDKSSDLSWQQLNVRNLPIGPARLLFLSKANSFKVLEKTRLPFLGGTIAINQLSWQAKKQQDPEIYFEGNMSNVSLEQLSRALNWTPLSGTISGIIPGVTYQNKTLRLGGELIIKVFDGAIKISNLAASGLFTDISRFYSDVEIDNLDLEQLTSKFEFGSITGKLSGFVKGLTMENWHPVTFFAWLGTPDDDDSTHRISQKAVKSIASIGGGGAADILSRSFLSLFETFGYDKIGLGCYLHDGVCQLMGVEATASGYAIITGGGLPRIDVIGYNPQVDWDVLMERLSRITTSDEIIIE